MGLASVTVDKNVDFPTFGNPRSPTSANNLSSNINSFSSPFSPSSENLGACLVGVAKCEFPLPPLPPFNINSVWFGSDKSATTFPVSASFITVPIGTFIYKSSPYFPLQWLPLPFSPSLALNFLLYLKSINVFLSLSTWK